MQDILGTQILAVEGQPTRNNNIRYAVKLADGSEPSTFKLEQAQKAQALIGQVVDVRISFSKDGKYKNFEDAAPSGQLSALAVPAGTLIPPAGIPGGIPAAGGIPMAAPRTQGGGGWPPEKEERISRQWALGTAFNHVAAVYTGAGPEALAEAKEHALALARELFHIGFHGTPPGAPVAGTPVAVAMTAPEVAAQVNEVMGAPAVQTASTTPTGPNW